MTPYTPNEEIAKIFLNHIIQAKWITAHAKMLKQELLKTTVFVW